MTKADILRVLERVPMNAQVVFVAPPAETIWTDSELEHEIKGAFTVTGMKGLTVVLTDGMVPSDYSDLESV